MPKAPPKGNKRGLKLKDPDVRQEAYRQYCAHIASGYPKQAFFFKHPVHSVTWETMDRYIAESPSEFSPLLIQEAKARRYKFWLDEGKALMVGRYNKGSPVVWQTIMRNMFKDIGWDREQISETGKTHVQQLAESIRKTPIFKAEECYSNKQQSD